MYTILHYMLCTLYTVLKYSLTIGINFDYLAIAKESLKNIIFSFIISYLTYFQAVARGFLARRELRRWYRYYYRRELVPDYPSSTSSTSSPHSLYSPSPTSLPSGYYSFFEFTPHPTDPTINLSLTTTPTWYKPRLARIQDIPVLFIHT